MDGTENNDNADRARHVKHIYWNLGTFVTIFIAMGGAIGFVLSNYNVHEDAFAIRMLFILSGLLSIAAAVVIVNICSHYRRKVIKDSSPWYKSIISSRELIMMLGVLGASLLVVWPIFTGWVLAP